MFSGIKRLECKTVADVLGDPEELLAEYKTLLTGVAETREKLKRELMDAQGGTS